MGVYLINNELNSLISVFEPVMFHRSPVTTGDGLLYYIQENPLAFVEGNYEKLNNDRFEELTLTIQQCHWMNHGEQLINELSNFRELEKWELAKELGDKYFENHEFDKSLELYTKFIEICESLSQRFKDKTGLLDHVYSQTGIILISIGEVNEGIELMDYAYKLHQSAEIQLQLTKYKIEFSIMDDLTFAENIVADILSEPTDSHKLSFLVWYYHYIGDLESSITSYMQIKNMDIRFKLVDYYMIYMLESNQRIAMESFLKPLKEHDEYRYLVELVDVLIELEQFEEALEVISGREFSLNKKNLICIQKSICNLGLKRIIESIRAINQINTNTLYEQDRERYYVQLSKLSKYSKDFSKEHIYNRQLLDYWQQKYRKIYSGILHNTKWKVNK